MLRFLAEERPLQTENTSSRKARLGEAQSRAASLRRHAHPQLLSKSENLGNV